MLTLDVLRSTSAGNCSILRSPEAAILIDCGAGSTAALKQKGKLTQPLDGIVITHIHGDHFSPAAIKIAKEHQCSIYLHPKMLNDLQKNSQGRNLKALLPQVHVQLHPGEFEIKDISVKSFDLVHGPGPDGPGIKCLGLVFNQELGYMTDTGIVTQKMLQALELVSTLLIEANHDTALEKRQAIEQPVMEYKVARALSAFGHLSNEQCGQAIAALLKSQGKQRLLRRVFLAHLSDTCNTHDLALRSVMDILDDAGFGQMDVQVAVDAEAAVEV